MSGDEITFHSFGFGLNQDGKPSVSFTITLPNGLQGSVGWEEDADDTLQRERFLAYYEPKIMNMLTGTWKFNFLPTTSEFEADKP